MEKGLLNQKKFDLNSKNLETEFESFRQETQERMKKYSIKNVLLLEKREDNFLNIVIIPCTDNHKGVTNQELGLEGFSVKSLSINELGSYNSSDINPVNPAIEFKF